MTRDTRRQILERRARYVAAATLMGAATFDAACEARACLEPAMSCDADPETRFEIEGPVKMCVGETTDLRLQQRYCGQHSDVTAYAVFTTSDSTVVAFDLPNSRTARALRAGRATVTAKLRDGSGSPTTLVIDVIACADASSDAPASDAADATGADVADAD